MGSVTVENVSKRYGDVQAVDDVSFRIDEGELAAILGPSGCGKTSTLKMIAGLESISEGTITIGERVVNDLKPEDRDIAMVFEDYSLYPRMNVLENVAFPLRVRRVPLNEIRRRVGEMLEILELTEVAQMHVQDLSGGQQQRVAIARALVREPAVLLLDEPLSHLDADLKVRLRTEIRWLQRERNVTTILVTHDQAEALALADRIAVMDGGRIHQYGPGHEVYENPADLFVAGFVGEPPMNLLPCLVEAGNGRPRLRSGELLVELPAGRFPSFGRTESGQSSEYLAGVRPEHVRLVPEGTPGSHAAEVFFSEWLGDERLVMLTPPGRSEHWLTSLVKGSLSIRDGERVALLVEPEHVLLFDGETGLGLSHEAELPGEGSAAAC